MRIGETNTLSLLSLLACKKGESSKQTRAVASDYAEVIMPKFNLVPVLITPMLTNDAQRFAQKLEGIKEDGGHGGVP